MTASIAHNLPTEILRAIVEACVTVNSRHEVWFNLARVCSAFKKWVDWCVIVKAADWKKYILGAYDIADGQHDFQMVGHEPDAHQPGRTIALFQEVDMIEVFDWWEYDADETYIIVSSFSQP
jgi:hypothetical protein